MKYGNVLLRSLYVALLISLTIGCSGHYTHTSLIPQDNKSWVTDTPPAPHAGYIGCEDLMNFYGNGAVYNCGANTILVHPTPLEMNRRLCGPVFIPFVPIRVNVQRDIRDHAVHMSYHEDKGDAYEDYMDRAYYSDNLYIRITIIGEDAEIDLKRAVKISTKDRVYEPINVLKYSWGGHPSYFVIFEPRLHRVNQLFLIFEQPWEDCTIERVEFVKERISLYDPYVELVD